MPRQTYKFNSQKQFFTFSDTSGGLNVRDSDDSLADNEFRELLNVDLGVRGSLPKRHGFTPYAGVTVAHPQGFFRFYGEGGVVTEFIAADGSLWKLNVDVWERITVSTYNETTGVYVADNAFRFQTALPIGAVQYGETMFFATGTKLLEYTEADGLRQVAPYKPTPTEVVKIGVNTLATNPLTYINTGLGSVLINEGMTASKDIGIIGQATTFTALFSKPVGWTVESKWEYRLSEDSAWTVLRDFSTTHTYDFTATEVGNYDIRTTLRQQGDADTAKYKIYILTEYKVSATDENHDIDYAGINTCTGIMMYYEQLLLYRSTTNMNVLYIGDVYRPNYFPANNSLTFSDVKSSKLQAIVRYYNVLVAFTENEIWQLSGQNPTNFAKTMVNSSIGCVAPFTVRAVNNFVFFLSSEGLFKLKSLYNNDNRLNVERLDLKIVEPLLESGVDISYVHGTAVPNSMPQDIASMAVASAIQVGDQYHLHFPIEKLRFRYYFEELNAWTLDSSAQMTFQNMYVFDGDVYAQSYTQGNVYKFTKGVYKDGDANYDAVISTRNMDLGFPYHKKKPKELFMFFQQGFEDTLGIKLYVWLDESLILTPDTYVVEVVNGEVVYHFDTLTENLLSLPASTALGTWEISESALGKKEGSRHSVRMFGNGHTIKFKIVDSSDKFVSLLSYGVVAKISKPTV